MEKHNKCPHCYNAEDSSKPLLDTSAMCTKHEDGYCGIIVSVEPEDNSLGIWVSSDTYEPWCEDYFIPINFCPVCGRKLRGGNGNE